MTEYPCENISLMHLDQPVDDSLLQCSIEVLTVVTFHTAEKTTSESFNVILIAIDFYFKFHRIRFIIITDSIQVKKCFIISI